MPTVMIIKHLEDVSFVHQWNTTADTGYVPWHTWNPNTGRGVGHLAGQFQLHVYAYKESMQLLYTTTVFGRKVQDYRETEPQNP